MAVMLRPVRRAGGERNSDLPRPPGAGPRAGRERAIRVRIRLPESVSGRIFRLRFLRARCSGFGSRVRPASSRRRPRLRAAGACGARALGAATALWACWRGTKIRISGRAAARQVSNFGGGPVPQRASGETARGVGCVRVLPFLLHACPNGTKTRRFDG